MTAGTGPLRFAMCYRGAMKPTVLACAALASSCLVGCLADADPDADPDLSIGSFAVTTTHLPHAMKVYSDFPIDHALLLPPQFYLAAGESAVIAAEGVNTSSDNELRMQELGIGCAGPSGTRLRIYSTQNREGPAAATRTQRTKGLLIADVPGNYACWLFAANKDFDGDTSAYHTYLEDTSLSISAAKPKGTGWHWGTENDPLYSESPDAVHVGPGCEAGGAEYALRSPRFTAPLSTSYVDVRFELELTTCKHGHDNCPSSAQGAWGDQWSGSVVDLQVVVQQMQRTDPSKVCKLTKGDPVRLTVTARDVHEKAHLALDDIPIDSTCSRDFIVKALVTHVDVNPIRIEPGKDGTTRYSTGFAYAHP